MLIDLVVILTIILGIVVAHFVGDYCLQVWGWCQQIMGRKHEKLSHLLMHGALYSLPMAVVAVLLIPGPYAELWLLGNVIAHMGVDAVTSRRTHHYHDIKRIDLFFFTLGIDQMLHGLCLFGSLYWVL